MKMVLQMILQNMKMVSLDYAHRNPEIVTCIPRYYRIKGLHTFWLALISKYENGITELRTSLSKICNLYSLGLRDYVHRNPEMVTCIPWYYRITRLHTFWPPSILDMNIGLLDYVYRNP